MKVITSEENKIEFDNGLVVTGEHSQDCCEHNYLDFTQLPVGTELPDQNATGFVASITIKDDGFIVRDIKGLPLWVQARSEQNGYYSNDVDMLVTDGKISLSPKKPGQTYGGIFTAGDGDIY